MRQWLSPRVLVAACLAVGVARIVATYHVFNQTWDEPAHVAAGMEWLDRGRYPYEPLHPPLARIMEALGPRLAGIRSAGQANVWLEGNAILYAGGRYDRNLALARLGVLPFFLLAAFLQPTGILLMLREYSRGGDPAYGSAAWADRSVVEVWRCYADRFEQVAEFCTPEITTYKYAWVICYMAGAYKNSMVNLEINGPGEAVLGEIDNLRR